MLHGYQTLGRPLKIITIALLITRAECFSVDRTHLKPTRRCINTENYSPSKRGRYLHALPIENTVAAQDDSLSSDTTLITPDFLSNEEASASSTHRGVGNHERLSEKAKGIIVLLTVPMIWGTYVPVVRGLYELVPYAMPGFLFSTLYFAVASLSSVCLLIVRSWGKNLSEELKPSTILAGLELGTYLFLGNCLQVVGLESVPSDRAGFLVQLTTILVPVLEATLAWQLLTVPAQTWFACVLALAGIAIMELDPSLSMSGLSLSSFFSLLFSDMSRGDGMIIAAAFMYTVHVVRLGKWAKVTTSLGLVATKATFELILSSILIVGLLFASKGNYAEDISPILSLARDSGNEIAEFVQFSMAGWKSATLPPNFLGTIVGATLWTGWVSTAFTIFAQSYGQRRISPSDANLMYSLQPIFTAVFAYVLLGEKMQWPGFVGGALIGSAVYLAATKTLTSSTNSDFSKL